MFGLDDLPSDVRDSVLSAAQLTAMPALEPPAKNFRVTLCSTCFCRDYQLKTSLAANLAILWPHRKYVRWMVVLCEDASNENQITEEWICQYYAEFLRTGVLMVGRAQPRDGYYHASVSKNTSNYAAVTAPEPGGRAPREINLQPGSTEGEKKHILVNLDCDNLMGLGFLPSLLEGFKAEWVHCLWWRGHESSTTGRIAMTEYMFLNLGGYDCEDVYGSGYQDIDLTERASYKNVLQKIHATKGTLQASRRVVGYPLPNSNIKAENKGKAKIVNCLNPDNLTWSQMNAHNTSVMKKRMNSKIAVRNSTAATAGYDVKWPCEMINKARPLQFHTTAVEELGLF